MCTNSTNNSLEWKIVVGRRFTGEPRTVGDEEDDKIMEEPSDGLHEKQKNLW